MSRHSAARSGAAEQLAELQDKYAELRARVVEAHAVLAAVTSRPHAHAEARSAAAVLRGAVSDATVVLLEAMRLQRMSGVTASSRGRGRRPASSPSSWSAELVRLGELAVWLRRTTIDETGVNVPATVRVGSRAATAPHQPGLEFEPEDLVAATIDRPRIGVDLRAIVDRDGPVAVGARKTSPAEHVLAA